MFICLKKYAYFNWKYIPLFCAILCRNNSSKNDNDNGSNLSGYSPIFINKELSSSDGSDKSGNSSGSYESIKVSIRYMY